MPFVRLIIAWGLVFFGCVAVFLATVVLWKGLSSDEITYSYRGRDGDVTTAVSRDVTPDAYWRGIALLGGLPLVAGLISVYGGRRMLRG